MGEASHMAIESIPTGSISLDIALGIGGIPYGRIGEIYGLESSGKSTLCQFILANVQRKGQIAAYIDIRIGHGRENAKDFLRNNQVMMQEIEDAIRSRIAYGSAAVALGNDGEDMTPAGGEV